MNFWIMFIVIYTPLLQTGVMVYASPPVILSLYLCFVPCIGSVNEGYLRYTQFRALQHFSSAVLSVLSTQVFFYLLCSVWVKNDLMVLNAMWWLQLRVFVIANFLSVTSICCWFATYTCTGYCCQLGKIFYSYECKWSLVPFFLFSFFPLVLWIRIYNLFVVLINWRYWKMGCNMLGSSYVAIWVQEWTPSLKVGES